MTESMAEQGENAGSGLAELPVSYVLLRGFSALCGAVAMMSVVTGGIDQPPCCASVFDWIERGIPIAFGLAALMPFSWGMSGAMFWIRMFVLAVPSLGAASILGGGGSS